MQDLLTKAPIKKQSVVNALEKEILRGTLAPGARMYGMRDLAKKFNVSYAVINAAYDVLVEKNLIVRKARKGTFVNPTFKYNGTKLIALITSYHRQDIEGYFEPLFEAANSANVLTIISTLDYNKDWQEIVSKVILRAPDAVIIDVEGKNYPIKEMLKLIGDTPYCFANHWEWRELKASKAVLNDYAVGYGKALKLLKKRGHKKIIILTHSKKVVPCLEKDFNDAAEMAGMSFGNELFYYSRDQFVKSKESLKAVYDKHKPTAIFGISDYLINFIVENGAKVCPEVYNLDKVGFHNQKYSNIPEHRFSTVKVNFKKIWSESFNMINNGKSYVYKVEPELIIR